MEKIFKQTICVIILISAFLALNNFAYASLAEDTFNVGKYLNLGEEDQPAKYLDDTEQGPIVAFILAMLNYATGIMGSIAVILFIIAGFRFMFANGDETKLSEAKEMIKYAVIGLAVTFLAYIIVIFVQSIFITEDVANVA